MLKTEVAGGCHGPVEAVLSLEGVTVGGGIACFLERRVSHGQGSGSAWLQWRAPPPTNQALGPACGLGLAAGEGPSHTGLWGDVLEDGVQMGCAHAHPPKVLLAPRTLQVPGEQTKHCPAQGPPIRWNKPRSFL